MIRFTIIAISLFIITACANLQAAAENSAETPNDCYNQIKKNLKKNDLVSISKTNGSTVSGLFSKLQSNKIILKEKSIFQNEMSSIFEISLDSIKTVQFSADQTKKNSNKKFKLALVGAGVGLGVREFVSTDIFKDDNRKNPSRITCTIVGITAGFVIGLIIDSKVESFPVTISFNCNH